MCVCVVTVVYVCGVCVHVKFYLDMYAVKGLYINSAVLTNCNTL